MKLYIKSAIDDIDKLDSLEDSLTKLDFLDLLGFYKDTDTTPTMYTIKCGPNGFIAYNTNQNKFYLVDNVDKENLTDAYIDLLYNGMTEGDFKEKYPDATIENYSFGEFIDNILDVNS